MGSRGAVPKRRDKVRGHRSKDEMTVDEIAMRGEVDIPPADPEWHPIAQRLWDSLIDSGQSRYYEPSDWAYAYSLVEDLSYYKAQNKRSGQMLTSVLSGLSSLLLTEGDRRRVKIEINREDEAVDDRTPGDDVVDNLLHLVTEQKAN